MLDSVQTGQVQEEQLRSKGAEEPQLPKFVPRDRTLITVQGGQWLQKSCQYIRFH